MWPIAPNSRRLTRRDPAHWTGSHKFEFAYKPDSVSCLFEQSSISSRRRPSIWDCRYRTTSCGLPETFTSEEDRRAVIISAWPCSGRGLPAVPVTRHAGGLLHHRFTLTVPCGVGGLLSVALSIGSRRLGITQHPCPVESGLSSRIAPGGRPANSSVTITRISRQ